jgi:hypothetical protein
MKGERRRERERSVVLLLTTVGWVRVEGRATLVHGDAKVAWLRSREREREREREHKRKIMGKRVILSTLGKISVLDSVGKDLNRWFKVDIMNYQI